MSDNWYCEVESLEDVQLVESLFKELGGEVFNFDNEVRIGIVVLAKNKIYSDHKHFTTYYKDAYSVKLLSIQQLKDLVVLKHNPIVNASTHGLSMWFTSNVMPCISDEDITVTTNDYEDQIISVSSPQEVQIVLNFLSLDGYSVDDIHQCNCPTCPDKPPEVVTHIHTFDDGSILLSNIDESFVCSDVTKFNDFVYDKI